MNVQGFNDRLRMSQHNFLQLHLMFLDAARQLLTATQDVVDQLHKRDSLVCTFVLMGVNRDELAASFNLTRKQVDQIVQRERQP